MGSKPCCITGGSLCDEVADAYGKEMRGTRRTRAMVTVMQMASMTEGGSAAETTDEDSEIEILADAFCSRTPGLPLSSPREPSGDPKRPNGVARQMSVFLESRRPLGPVACGAVQRLTSLPQHQATPPPLVVPPHPALLAMRGDDPRLKRVPLAPQTSGDLEPLDLPLPAPPSPVHTPPVRRLSSGRRTPSPGAKQEDAKEATYQAPLTPLWPVGDSTDHHDQDPAALPPQRGREAPGAAAGGGGGGAGGRKSPRRRAMPQLHPVSEECVLEDIGLPVPKFADSIMYFEAR